MEQNMIVQELSTDEFKRFVSDGSLAVIDFYAKWCSPCMMMAPMIENIAKKHEKVRFGKIDVETARDIPDNNNVCSLPCIIFFKEGKETGRLVGPVTEGLIEEKIKINLR